MRDRLADADVSVVVWGEGGGGAVCGIINQAQPTCFLGKRRGVLGKICRSGVTSWQQVGIFQEIVACVGLMSVVTGGDGGVSRPVRRDGTAFVPSLCLTRLILYPCSVSECYINGGGAEGGGCCCSWRRSGCRAINGCLSHVCSHLL